MTPPCSYTLVHPLSTVVDYTCTRTALMLAARDGRLSLVKLLTESKADPEVKDNQRFKALDYAVTQNHQE